MQSEKLFQRPTSSANGSKGSHIQMFGEVGKRSLLAEEKEGLHQQKPEQESLLRRAILTKPWL
jgi:hypothetical protein